MSTSEFDPPAYEDIAGSTEHIDQYPYSSPLTRLDQHLYDQVRTFRTDHIREVISNALLPIVQNRVEKGLSRTSIALIPANTASTSTATTSPGNAEVEDPDSTVKVIDIVSSHGDDDDLQQIQLTDSIDTSAFWSQPAVVNELRRCLKTQLASYIETKKIASDSLPAKSYTKPSSPTSQPLQAQSKSHNFFARKLSSNRSKRTGTSGQELPSDNTSALDPSELVMIGIASDEICMRVQNHFGLYQTMTSKVVIVRVRISV